MKKHYIANLLKALIPVRHYEDKARQTVKETTSHNKDKNIVNLKTNNQNYLHYTDKVRQTVKEIFLIQDKNIINLKVELKIYKDILIKQNKLLKKPQFIMLRILILNCIINYLKEQNKLLLKL